jgi:hypothetical protein
MFQSTNPAASIAVTSVEKSALAAATYNVCVSATTLSIATAVESAALLSIHLVFFFHHKK